MLDRPPEDAVADAIIYFLGVSECKAFLGEFSTETAKAGEFMSTFKNRVKRIKRLMLLQRKQCGSER